SWANARLAGLLRNGDGGKQLVPLLFAELTIADAPEGAEPVVQTRLPARDWVFRWDPERRVAYLLAVPRKGARELTFRLRWETLLRSEAAVGTVRQAAGAGR
ncbi:MAG TPA: hypothetical protein VIL46_09120, partial [Gemmataceae bacterium]